MLRLCSNPAAQLRYDFRFCLLAAGSLNFVIFFHDTQIVLGTLSAGVYDFRLCQILILLDFTFLS